VLAVATFLKDPYGVAALELLRLGALPPKDVITAAGDFDLPKLLAEVSP
jgi:hypothetical protein